jgi:hypothetical protein
MTRDLIRHNRPVFDHVHPRIFATAIGFVAWFVLAAWILFDHKFDTVDDMALPLAMASVLLFLTVLLLSTLMSMSKRHRLPRDGEALNIPFQDWKHGDFAVWGSRLKSTHAAIDILLPLAAAAFGLTAIGVVFLICASTTT